MGSLDIRETLRAQVMTRRLSRVVNCEHTAASMARRSGPSVACIRFCHLHTIILVEPSPITFMKCAVRSLSARIRR